MKVQLKQMTGENIVKYVQNFREGNEGKKFVISGAKNKLCLFDDVLAVTTNSVSTLCLGQSFKAFFLSENFFDDKHLDIFYFIDTLGLNG